MPIVDLKNVTFEYIRRDNEGNVDGITTAVDGVSLKVSPGEFIAVLGANGSGKSTLAKHINALLFPTEGAVFVDGMNTADEDKLLDIRSTAGMIFQNPDDQIIGQIVEERKRLNPNTTMATMVSGAGYCEAYMIDQNGYRQILKDFLQQYFK